MTTKLHQGVPIYILNNGKIIDRAERPEEANGQALTHEQLIDRDRMICQTVLANFEQEVKFVQSSWKSKEQKAEWKLALKSLKDIIKKRIRG